MAGGPAGGGGQQCSPAAPAQPSPARGPGAGGRQDLHHRRQPQRDVSSSGNDGKGLTAAAGGQRGRVRGRVLVLLEGGAGSA